MDSLQQQPHPPPSLHHPHQARHLLNRSAPDYVEGYSECIRHVRFSRAHVSPFCSRSPARQHRYLKHKGPEGRPQYLLVQVLWMDVS